MDVLKFELPYPPSINHYYIRSSRGVVLGSKGKSYRREVFYLLRKYRDAFGYDKRLTLTIHVFTPDNRKRDLDNICKASIDSIQYARVFEDDNQIDRLVVTRCDTVKNGKLIVWINEC